MTQQTTDNLFREAAKYLADMGIWAIDRPLSSCDAGGCKTHACRHCYVLPLYASWGEDSNTTRGMRSKDRDVNVPNWEHMTPAAARAFFGMGDHDGKRRQQVTRFRLCSRGEPFATADDVRKVAGMVAGTPGTLWWIPTKMHRNPARRQQITDMVRSLPNARVAASVDYTTTPAEHHALVRDGWSRMYFGDDATAERFGYACPKTFRHAPKACRTCKGGCYAVGRTDVGLKFHSANLGGRARLEADLNYYRGNRLGQWTVADKTTAERRAMVPAQ
jgi:hypothetical protein